MSESIIPLVGGFSFSKIDAFFLVYTARIFIIQNERLSDSILSEIIFFASKFTFKKFKTLIYNIPEALRNIRDFESPTRYTDLTNAVESTKRLTVCTHTDNSRPSVHIDVSSYRVKNVHILDHFYIVPSLVPIPFPILRS